MGRQRKKIKSHKEYFDNSMTNHCLTIYVVILNGWREWTETHVGPNELVHLVASFAILLHLTKWKKLTVITDFNKRKMEEYC